MHRLRSSFVQATRRRGVRPALRSLSTQTAKSISPTTGDVIAEYELWSDSQAQAAAARGAAAFKGWKRTSFAERSAMLNKCAAILRNNSADYSVLMAVRRRCSLWCAVDNA